MPIYYKKVGGKPVAGSNRKFAARPSTRWSPAQVVVGGPLTNDEKVPFSGSNRYFVEHDNSGRLIPASIIVSTVVPVGQYYEIFANNLITLPLNSQGLPGLVDDDPEEVVEVERLMSYEYLQNGSSTSRIAGNR